MSSVHLPEEWQSSLFQTLTLMNGKVRMYREEWSPSTELELSTTMEYYNVASVQKIACWSKTRPVVRKIIIKHHPWIEALKPTRLLRQATTWSCGRPLNHPSKGWASGRAGGRAGVRVGIFGCVCVHGSFYGHSLLRFKLRLRYNAGASTSVPQSLRSSHIALCLGLDSPGNAW